MQRASADDRDSVAARRNAISREPQHVARSQKLRNCATLNSANHLGTDLELDSRNWRANFALILIEKASSKSSRFGSCAPASSSTRHSVVATMIGIASAGEASAGEGHGLHRARSQPLHTGPRITRRYSAVITLEDA